MKRLMNGMNYFGFGGTAQRKAVTKADSSLRSE
jgi:hypothetical protein